MPQQESFSEPAGIEKQLPRPEAQVEEVTDPVAATERVQSMGQEYLGASQHLLAEIHDGNPDPELQAEFQQLDQEAQAALAAAEGAIHVATAGEEGTPFDETQRRSALSAEPRMAGSTLQVIQAVEGTGQGTEAAHESASEETDLRTTDAALKNEWQKRIDAGLIDGTIETVEEDGKTVFQLQLRTQELPWMHLPLATVVRLNRAYEGDHPGALSQLSEKRGIPYTALFDEKELESYINDPARFENAQSDQPQEAMAG